MSDQPNRSVAAGCLGTVVGGVVGCIIGGVIAQALGFRSTGSAFFPKAGT